jgi:hypothetical protein
MNLFHFDSPYLLFSFGKPCPKFHWSLILVRRALLKTKPGLLRLRHIQLASAERAGIEARRYVAHQHGRALPLDRYLSADRAAGATTGRVRAEETCPPSQPLVQSVRAVVLVHWVHWPRILGQSYKKGE